MSPEEFQSLQDEIKRQARPVVTALVAALGEQIAALHADAIAKAISGAMNAGCDIALTFLERRVQKRA